MFDNDVLNNILKLPLPTPGAFFYGGFNSLNEFEDGMGIPSPCHHWCNFHLFWGGGGKTVIIPSGSKVNLKSI